MKAYQDERQDAYQASINLVRGDDEPFQVIFTDVENHNRPLNLTGYTVMFTLKKDPKDTDENAILALDFTDHPQAADGIALIDVTDSDWDTGYKGNPVPSGQYHFDIQYVDPDGKPKTIMIGIATVIQDVSHRTEAAA